MFSEQNPVFSGVKVDFDTETKFPNYAFLVPVKFQTPDHTS